MTGPRYTAYVIAAFVIAVLVAVLPACKGNQDASPALARANVFIITMDTTRADHIGAFGSKTVKTPNLDALAADSVVFDGCWSAVHSTNPSHTSIFSSLYVRDHGVLDNKTRVPDMPWFLPNVFKAAGYRTAAITSGGHLDRVSNINQVFDEFYSAEEGYESVAEDTTQQAVNVLDSLVSADKDARIFMWVHYFDPHIMYDPPAPYNSMYTATSDERLNWNEYFKLDYPRHKEYFGISADPEFYRNLYKGEVSYMDEQIGRFVSELKKKGIYDTSVVVVVADHGESLGEHDIYWDHRGIFDTTIHVPMMIKPASGFKPGHRTQLVSSIDIYPTLMDLTGIQAPGTIMGKSLAGILTNPNYPEVRNTVYYQSVFESAIGVKTRDYTYIRVIMDGQDPAARTLVPVDKGSPILLINASDPGQTLNYVRARPEVAASMEQKAAAFIADRQNTPASVEITDKEHLKKLKALGYLQ